MKVVDVRSRLEYASGHVNGSVNIPVNELAAHLDELKAIDGTILLCCASGGRSAMAKQFLMQQGFTNVEDGGPWTSVQYKLMNETK